MENKINDLGNQFLAAYIELCEIATKRVKDGLPIDAEVLSALNDSARVINGHILGRNRQPVG